MNANAGKIDEENDNPKVVRVKPKAVADPSQGTQEHLFGIPMMEGLQTRPGRVMSGVAVYPPLPGAAVYLRSAPRNGSYFPFLSITTAAEYAQMRVDAIRDLLVAAYGTDDLIILSAQGGDWMDAIRTAIMQSVIDGYAALETGVPVAIPGDAMAVSEQYLQGKG